MHIFNEISYELIKNNKEGFDYEEVKLRFTDYFEKFDYVFGDWAYGKLRLKGFYKSVNKNVKEFNDIKNLDIYIEENCAVECRYFLLEKKNNTVE